MSTEGPPQPVVPPEMERRTDERVAARIDVRFREPSEAARAFRAYSLNFSVGGLCLKTRRPYEIGARLSLALTLESQAYELTGVVAWKRGAAIGVRFENLAPEVRRRLGEILERYRAPKPVTPSPSRR